MATRCKHPFLFVEETAKIWIEDASGPMGKIGDGNDASQPPILPKPEGMLNDPLAFPLYLVRDSKGKDSPAPQSVWDSNLIWRILRGGEWSQWYHYDQAHPSEIYCLQLLSFHYGKLADAKKYKFISYLRDLLKRRRAHVSQQIALTTAGEGLYQVYMEGYKQQYDIISFCLGWLDDTYRETKDIRLRAKAISEVEQRFNGKAQVLAHLILILSGLTRLGCKTGEIAQRTYIVEKTGLHPLTVKRYLKTQPGGKTQNLIYTRDYLMNAFDYIDTLEKGIRRSSLKLPREIRATA